MFQSQSRRLRKTSSPKGKATRLPLQLLLQRKPLGCGGHNLREETAGIQFCFSSQSFWNAGAARKVSQTRSSLKMRAFQNLFFTWTYQNRPLIVASDSS